MAKKSFGKLKIILIVLCAVCAGAFLLVFARKKLAPRQQEGAVYTVRAETYENAIEIAGTVSAAQEQSLQALGTGTVIGVYAKQGDRLKKGDLIVQLDSSEQEYNLANLDYQMASARVTGSAREIELMETQRLSLLQKIADRRIIATFDGIMAELDVDAGDSLEAKDSIGTLVNVDYLIAEVEIPETDIQKLRENQRVDFTFPAYDGEVQGYVWSWPAIGTVTTRGATVVKAKIRIDDYPAVILPNFSFTGRIQITEPVTNIVVERWAVGYEDGRAFVEFAGKKGRVYVQTEPYGEEYVKILDGLSGGEILREQAVPPPSGMNRMRGGSGRMRVR